jgi:hypothetical protein
MSKHNNSTDNKNPKDAGIDGLINGALGRSIPSGGSPDQAFSMLNNLIKTYEEVHRIDETEKTKRQDIERQRQVALAQISAQKEILLTFLNHSFVERRLNFVQVFKIMDDALVKRDNEQLALGLKSMTELAATSPFGPLKEILSTRKALENKSQEWEF